ncbi:MAG: family 14 glycosylhydrolase [Victivallales bacterium]|nr:family 14 glycosylhydrolase [Victivallales bacterium]
MRLPFSAITLTCVLAWSSCAAAAEPRPHGRNLLANPSFEEDLSGWRFWRQFPEECAGDIDREAARFGKASFKVTNPGRGGANLYSENVPCEPGKPYTISVYVRTDGVAKAGLTAWGLAEDGETTITHGIGGTVRLPPDELRGFTRFRHMFITSENCHFVRAHLTCNGGTVWWDAVQIEEGAGRDAGPYEDAQVLAEQARVGKDASRNLLPNSSFEISIAGWQLWQQLPGESTGEVEQATGATGEKAFHIANRGTKGSNFFNEGVLCKPGETYTLSAYVMTRNSSGVRVASWALDAGGRTISYAVGEAVDVPASTGSLVRVTKTFEAPAEAARLRAHLICNGGEVWWDAVQLEHGPNATEYVDGPELPRHWEEAAAYAKAVVREARARDLMQQVDRLMRYRSRAVPAAEDARQVLADAAMLMQADNQVPDYVNLDPLALNAKLAAAESALTSAFRDLTEGREPSHAPWQPKLPPQVGKQQLFREFLIFPIMSGHLLGGKASWDVLEPFGWRALSIMHSRGFERPDGSFDFSSMLKSVDLLREHGYHTVFELTPYTGGMMQRLETELGEDAFFHNAEGEWSPRSHCHDVINIWHQQVRSDYANCFRAMGEAMHGVPNVLAYELINEPSMQIAKPKEGGDQYDWQGIGFGGYSGQARVAWTAWLQAKYGAIEKLNQQWGREYGAFGDVSPPADTAPPAPSDSRTRHPVADIVDFHRFRAESHTQFYAGHLRALHEGDPKHAVMSQFCGLAPDRKEAGLDYLDMACRAPWDIFGTHDWPGDRPAVLSLYAASMNRYAKLPHWEDEFIWSQWETKGTPEPVMRAANERNLWRQIAYGKRGIILFNLADEWAHTKPNNWNNSILNVEVDYQIPRYSTGIFPVIERKVNAFKEAVLDTELANQGVAILRPTTSSYGAAPNHTTRREASALASWLLPRHWMPFFVPEECILDGREDMTAVRVLIAPYATHVMAGLEESILAWVEAGGTLICSGPFGLFDEYGTPQGRLMARAMGIDQLDFSAQDGVWQIAKQSGRGNVRTIGEGVLAATYGQGKVWLSVAPLSKTAGLAALREPLLAALSVQPITCDITEGLELVLRRRDDGRHYLFATNLNPRQKVDTTVLLPGRCGEVVDLCVEGGATVPAKQEDLAVRIPLYLAPGKGVVFSLGKWTKLNRNEERRLRDALVVARQRQFDTLLAVVGKPASTPLASARRQMAHSFALMAREADDLDSTRHYVECSGPASRTGAGLTVPHLANAPGIDADLAEWRSAKWSRIGSGRKVLGKTSGDDDLSARFALGRHSGRLFLALDVRDDAVRNTQSDETLWQEDCLEVFFDLMEDGDQTGGRYGFDDIQFFLAVGGRQHVQAKQVGMLSKFRAKRSATGYTLEAEFDLAKMGVVLEKGLLIGFDIAVDDADGEPMREAQITWRGTAANHRDTRQFGRLLFD